MISLKQYLSRSDCLVLIRTALSVGADRFARRAAIAWLTYYPGDLPIRELHARSLVESGAVNPAEQILEELLIADPEALEAQKLLLKVYDLKGSPKLPEAKSQLFSLGDILYLGEPKPSWAGALQAARKELFVGNLEAAEEYIHQTLIETQITPLIAVTHLQISAKKDLPGFALRDLAGLYHDRWPGCLVCKLILAKSLMEGGQPEKAVDLLHQAASMDITAQVSTRLWGQDHRYMKLWPTNLKIRWEIPIPIDIAAELGWNQLPSGDLGITQVNSTAPAIPIADKATLERDPDGELTHPTKGQPSPLTSNNTENVDRNLHRPYPRSIRPSSARPKIPKSLRLVQKELQTIASRLKHNYLAHSDGRFPVYVLFTTKKGLETHYGRQFRTIDSELKRIVKVIDARPDWRAVLLYADDPSSTGVFGLGPAHYDDAWELKLTLADLDHALAKKGEMIGAVLIVGGPEIVPFHHLPNPVDDVDIDVPSDNPYASSDENYFVPEWIVGRLPGGAQYNAEPLLHMLRDISSRHRNVLPQRPWLARWLKKLYSRMTARRFRPSWGYTAAIWRRASLSVFRPIGQPHSMMVSPPVQVNGHPGRTQKNDLLPSARLGYFNLHGLEDSSEWYGQRDPTEPGNDPDYPVALRPRDVINGGHAPQIIFTEACYGAHILNKTVEKALSLKFLSSGAGAVVGSTCTSYGSISAPLIAADLLGQTFWKYLREAMPAGEALRRAKISTAHEMLRRQGYLDGEDQKTLISFVLYGDPLVQKEENGARSNQIYRSTHRPTQIRTICDRANAENHSSQSSSSLYQEKITQVKLLVEQYLPGMTDANIICSQEHAGCKGFGHYCPTSQLGGKSLPLRKPSRSVFTLSKQIEVTESHESTPDESNFDVISEGRPEIPLFHQHFARITLDEAGNLVKLAVSR